MGKKKTAIVQSTLPPRILNAGLDLATLEWGDIRESLAERYPELTPEQLAECNTVCQAAQTFGYAQIGELNIPKLDTVYEDGFADFRRLVTARYPWVNPENLSRLFSQGIKAMLR